MRAGQRVHLQLRTEILNGDLAPGAPLGEVELSERFGTSRTPVREALGLLAADGLAEQIGGRGTAVSRISAADIEPLFELREALEVKAARLAAVRCTPGDFVHLGDELVVLVRDGVLVQLDRVALQLLCLLYTSPSPRDRTRSRMPSSA